MYDRTFSPYALAPFHKYRQNALTNAAVVLIRGASLMLTSLGHFLPGPAQIKGEDYYSIQPPLQFLRLNNWRD